jgi:hypothetical protein
MVTVTLTSFSAWLIIVSLVTQMAGYILNSLDCNR